MTSITALVLAGGSLAGKRLGPSPPLSAHPAELADGSGLALDHICQRSRHQPEVGCIRVVVDAPWCALRPMRHQPHWQWFTILPQANVLASLAVALEAVSSDQVLLQPITTLPPLSLPSGTWIGLGEHPLPREDWSGVSGIATDQIRFHPKRQPPDRREPNSHPFTGLIAAPVALLRDLLAARRRQADGPPGADEDLLTLAEELWRLDLARLVTMPWLDLGHRATASRRRLSRLTSRGFNSVSYCPSGDLIRKHSRDRQRLQQEAAYFQALPQPLQRFFLHACASRTMPWSWNTCPFPAWPSCFCTGASALMAGTS